MNSIDRVESTKMHKDFFDQAQFAIERGYYLESIMYEYAAIESRLEVICGLFGCPCNREIDDTIRSKINISQRIKCLKALYKKHPACKDSTTKVTPEIWKRLQEWIVRRNKYVHGLYKRPELYVKRLEDRSRLAIEGLELAKYLYNEAKRIRRLRKNHPELMLYDNNICRNKSCRANPISNNVSQG